ncbi:hypothetical protein AVEN_183153-1, partial [Araneus ventricosus]
GKGVLDMSWSMLDKQKEKHLSVREEQKRKTSIEGVIM